MGLITCGNAACKMRRGPFCGAELTPLNEMGQCKVWFQQPNQLRAEPLYDLVRKEENKEEQS